LVNLNPIAHVQAHLINYKLEFCVKKNIVIHSISPRSCIENLYIAGNFKAGQRIQIED